VRLVVDVIHAGTPPVTVDATITCDLVIS
jgi:hypothetical protein